MEVDILNLLNFEGVLLGEVQPDHLKLKMVVSILQNRTSNEVDYITNIAESFINFIDQEQKIAKPSKNPSQS